MLQNMLADLQTAKQFEFKNANLLSDMQVDDAFGWAGG